MEEAEVTIMLPPEVMTMLPPWLWELLRTLSQIYGDYVCLGVDLRP